MPLRLYAHPLFKSERESLFFFLLLDVGQRLRMEHSWAGCHGVGRHHGPSTPTQQQQHTKAKKSWHYYILAFFLLFSTALPNQKKNTKQKSFFFQLLCCAEYYKNCLELLLLYRDKWLNRLCRIFADVEARSPEPLPELNDEPSRRWRRWCR